MYIDMSHWPADAVFVYAYPSAGTKGDTMIKLMTWSRWEVVKHLKANMQRWQNKRQAKKKVNHLSFVNERPVTKR